MSLLGTLFGRKPTQPRLTALLGDYPPYEPPFRMARDKLSVEEAQANLAYLHRVRAERLASFARFLMHFGINLEAGLAATPPNSLLHALWRWTLDDWPQIYDQDIAATDLRFDSCGSGAIFGLQADLALTLGEILQRHRQDCRWGLDLAPNHRDMTSFRQACILFDAPQRQAPTLDVFGVAQFAYRHCKQGSYTVMNYLADTVRAYLESAPTAGPVTRAIKLYDNADYHMSEPDDTAIPARWGATHLVFFAFWLAEHRLFVHAVQQRTAKLLTRTQSPFDWLWTERDGCLAEDDLTPEGNRFARAYYGTPDQGLRSGPGSYLQDFIDILKGGDDKAFIEDSWMNYDRLKPVIERRWAELESSE